MKSAHFLVLPGVHILDLAGPLQVLSTVQELGIAPLAVGCIGPHSSVRAFENVLLGEVAPLPARVDTGDVVLVIGSKLQPGLPASAAWRDAAAWLRRVARPDGAARPTMAAVCTGAFLLGDAGLLDGRSCTTHHSLLGRLRKNYPRADVLDNRVFVRDGPVWSSAGVASGIDLALNLVAQHFGDEAALRVARENVVPFRRFSADPELAPQFRTRSHANPLIHAVQDAMGRDLSLVLSDPGFAQGFCVSTRHLGRLFTQELGMSPKRYQLSLRMARARELLASSNLSIDAIAGHCGFGSVQAFRAQWSKTTRLAPSAFRQQHRRIAERIAAL